MNWQPNASIDRLRQRADILTTIRDFFAQAKVLEVETPLLNNSAIVDAHLQLLSSQQQQQTLYLQPSPEAAMKRLLAARSGPIYQISKAFRQDECGRLHNPEFTLLEWYQPDFDHHALMNEVDALLHLILHCDPAERISYTEIFQQTLSINPLLASLDDLQQCIQQQNIQLHNIHDLDKDACLDCLMTHCIEPQLQARQAVFIYDYPASQAALARIRAEDHVAERFEVYYHGIELANGYHELTDADEQQQRFHATAQQRQAAGLAKINIDEALLAALNHGLPTCAGVAMGIDRLVMLASQARSIDDVISFRVQGEE